MTEILHGWVEAEKPDGIEMVHPFDGSPEEIKTKMTGFAVDGWHAKWTEDKPDDAPRGWTARSSERWPV